MPVQEVGKVQFEYQTGLAQSQRPAKCSNSTFLAWAVLYEYIPSMLIISCFCTYNYNSVGYNLVPRAMPVRRLVRHWLWGNRIFPVL